MGRHPQVFLASAIDPPGVAAVETAMEQLVGINAVEPLMGQGWEWVVWDVVEDSAVVGNICSNGLKCI